MKSATFHPEFLHFSARKVRSSKSTRADKNLHFLAYSSPFRPYQENAHATNAYLCIVERYDSELLKLTFLKEILLNNIKQSGSKLHAKINNFVRMNTRKYILLAYIVKLLQ